MRFKFFFILVLAITHLLQAEIIQKSKLKTERKPLSVKRDLFLPSGMMNSLAPQESQPTQISPETKLTLQETLAQSIQYEGSFSIGDTMVALLNVSGESFSVKEGEMILDQIKIIKITDNQVIVEYEGQTFTITKNREM